jgi:glucokinase
VTVAASPVVLGLDYGGTKIAAAVCDLAGEQLASATVASDGALGAQASFGRGISVARDLLGTTAPDGELVAVGVSTFGIPFEDRVELAPAIDGWDGLAMGRELRAAFAGAQIRMATDAKAAAQAEARWGALAGCDPAVYLNLGTGLAAAVVIGGQVVAGVNGAAGEIGYNLRSVADVGRALDRRVLLEHMVSGQALAERAAGPEGGERNSRRLTAADVFAAAATDRRLDRLIDDFADELAFHLVNLAILVNPQRIAVGGGMVRSWARIRSRLQDALEHGTPFPPELVVAHFPHDAPLLGAVAMAVDAARGRADADRPADHDGRAQDHADGADGASHGAIQQDTINTGTLS